MCVYSMGDACQKCMHSQTMSNNRGFVFCTYWVEVVNKLHACIYFENNNDSFYQSLKPFQMDAYKRIEGNETFQRIKEKKPEFLKGYDVKNKEIRKRTKNAFK